MALNRGNERLPCLQPKIRSGNGRPVFSRSGNRTIARTFYAVDKSLRGGAWNQCMLCSSLENERVSRMMARGRNCEFRQRRMSVYQQQNVDSIE